MTQSRDPNSETWTIEVHKSGVVTPRNPPNWWTPSVDNYLGSVPKARIRAVVAEAVSEHAAVPLAKLKKAAITKMAEQQIVGTGWLPSILRTA